MASFIIFYSIILILSSSCLCIINVVHNDTDSLIIVEESSAEEDNIDDEDIFKSLHENHELSSSSTPSQSLNSLNNNIRCVVNDFSLLLFIALFYYII